jgi:excisionase family DNA binding protein
LNLVQRTGTDKVVSSLVGTGLNPMATLERLLSQEEVSDLLGVTRAGFYRLVRGGLLPAVRLGRHIRVSPAALQRFIETGGRPLEADSEQHEPAPAA